MLRDTPSYTLMSHCIPRLIMMPRACQASCSRSRSPSAPAGSSKNCGKLMIRQVTINCLESTGGAVLSVTQTWLVDRRRRCGFSFDGDFALVSLLQVHLDVGRAELLQQGAQLLGREARVQRVRRRGEHVRHGETGRREGRQQRKSESRRRRRRGTSCSDAVLCAAVPRTTCAAGCLPCTPASPSRPVAECRADADRAAPPREERLGGRRTTQASRHTRGTSCVSDRCR